MLTTGFRKMRQAELATRDTSIGQRPILTMGEVYESSNNVDLLIKNSTESIWTLDNIVSGSIKARFRVQEQLAVTHQQALYTNYRAQLTITYGKDGGMEILSSKTHLIEEDGSKSKELSLREFEAEFQNFTPRTAVGYCTVTVSISPIRRVECNDQPDPLCRMWQTIDCGKDLISASFDVCLCPGACSSDSPADSDDSDSTYLNLLSSGIA